MSKEMSKYDRLLKCKCPDCGSTVHVTVDVYSVLNTFAVHNPATAHALKKLLAAGTRGYKDTVQDLEEAIVSIKRAIELESDNKL